MKPPFASVVVCCTAVPAVVQNPTGKNASGCPFTVTSPRTVVVSPELAVTAGSSAAATITTPIASIATRSKPLPRRGREGFAATSLILPLSDAHPPGRLARQSTRTTGTDPKPRRSPSGGVVQGPS